MNELGMISILFLLVVVVIVQGVLLIKFIDSLGAKFQFSQVKLAPSDFDVTKMGLPLGEPFPQVKEIRTPRGDLFQIGLGRSSVIIFTSENCQACRGLLPQLRGFGAGLPVDIWILQVGPEARAAETQGQVGGPIRVAAVDYETANSRLRTKIFPFAYLVDGNGTIASKSIVPSRDHVIAMLSNVGLQKASGASRT
jgi:hypothetical protein